MDRTRNKTLNTARNKYKISNLNTLELINDPKVGTRIEKSVLGQFGTGYKVYILSIAYPRYG